MSSTRPSRKRTVFSLTPKELFELRQLNINVNVTVPPRRPLRSDGFESYHEYSYDLGIYERYRDNHARAKYERSDWLREHRITLAVAAQASQAGYHPFANAARLELVAPEMPPDFDAEWKTLFTPKPRPKPSGEGTFTLPNGLKGFSF